MLSENPVFAGTMVLISGLTATIMTLWRWRKSPRKYLPTNVSGYLYISVCLLTCALGVSIMMGFNPVPFLVKDLRVR